MHRDIIGRALAGAAIPGNEQVAIGAFHNARGVIVLRMEREDEPGPESRRFGGVGGRGKADRGAKREGDSMEMAVH